MSLMMARNADSATKTTAQVLKRLGSLVASRKGGNHRLSAKFPIRLHAELAARREPNNRSGKVCRVGELERKKARSLPADQRPPCGSDHRRSTVQLPSVEAPKIVMPNNVEAITAAKSFAVLN